MWSLKEFVTGKFREKKWQIKGKRGEKVDKCIKYIDLIWNEYKPSPKTILTEV